MANTTYSQLPGAVVAQEKIPATYHSRNHYRGPRPLTILFSVLALIALLHFIVVMQMASSQVAAPTNCQQLLRSADYSATVHLQSGKQEMEAVQITNQITGKQPSALVQVMNTGPQQKLDVYVFGCAMHKQTPMLTTLLAQRGLIQGNLSISAANTLVTSEQDTSLSAQAAAVEQPLQSNIFREYGWRNGALVQVAFPGFYPVVSRSEAEQLQQQANAGQPLAWSDPLATAEQMAKDMLKWPHTNPQDAVLSNDSLTAKVLLIDQSPLMAVTVTLQRLVQHDNQGLWFVTAAQTAGMTLDQSHLTTPATSPISLRGTGALADGQTTAVLFDHTLTSIPLLSTSSLNVNAGGSYSGSASYANTLANQQGALLIQSLPPTDSQESGQIFLTSVILG